MSKILPDPPPGFDDWSVDDQIEYLQSLWDRITASAGDLPVPQWHREIIRRRIAELESDPDAAVPWEKARQEITARLDGK